MTFRLLVPEEGGPCRIGSEAAYRPVGLGWSSK